MSPLESGSTCEALVFYSPGRRLSPKLAQSRSADARLWSGGAERFRVGGQSGHPYSALQCPLIIQLGHWTGRVVRTRDVLWPTQPKSTLSPWLEVLTGKWRHAVYSLM